MVVHELPPGLKWTTFSAVVALWGCLYREMLSSHKTGSKLLPVAPIRAVLIFSLCMRENVTSGSSLEIGKVNEKPILVLIPPYICHIQYFFVVTFSLRYF